MPLSPPILSVVHDGLLEGDKLKKIHEMWRKKSTKNVEEKSTKVEELGGFVFQA